MNRAQAKEILPIIQAYAEGKTIQFKSVQGWKDAEGSIAFDCIVEAYRIKPEPRKFWLVKRKDDMPDAVTVYVKEPTASNPSLYDQYEVIPVIEVLK